MALFRRSKDSQDLDPERGHNGSKRVGTNKIKQGSKQDPECFCLRPKRAQRCSKSTLATPGAILDSDEPFLVIVRRSKNVCIYLLSLVFEFARIASTVYVV